VVVGTRPEAIKLAPVIRSLAEVGLPSKLIFTGQHPRLDPDEFGLPLPAVDLSCPGEELPHEHVRKVTAALMPLMSAGPDLLIVQGDTSSALGAALAGFAAGVPVAHVEAGLRTHDPQLPWPEEEYRTAIDARADLLFAPTENAAGNLRREDVRGQIHVTGNTGIDALLALVADLPPPAGLDGPPRLLVTCHRRESWGKGLRSIAAALRELAEGPAQIDFVLHPNVHVERAMREELGGRPNIRLIAPCGHRDLVEHMRAADLILSDSGGFQEEAPALGVPLLVLRDKTERPEALASGNARLVGTNAERIVAETRRLLDDPAELRAMAHPALPFGDGHAAPRIARIVDEWLRA
jgi:UDP-N-acetylglucosamine 2-epimerase (non-hydrolysing)